jgi:hypothetical protein
MTSGGAAVADPAQDLQLTIGEWIGQAHAL